MDLKACLSDALAAAFLGSNVMMSFYKSNCACDYKDGDGQDPHERIFTEADIRTQVVVTEYLRSRSGDEIGLLAEEGELRDSSSRFKRDQHWQVDPIDGTLGFKKETDNFGISVALVSREGSALVGVLYNPARNLLAYACHGAGAILNNALVKTSTHDGTEGLKIIVSANQLNRPRMRRALDLFARKTVLDAESNVTKAIRVFDGEADLFFGLPNVTVHVWDLAAISIIAEESGCVLTDFGGNSIDLNHNDTIWPYGFILSNGSCHSFALECLSRWAKDSEARTYA